VGVVTDRDLVVRFLADGGTDAEGTLVGDVMTRDVTTLGADQDLEAAATLMRERQVRRLVVTDADGVVVGVLSHGDLVQATDGEGAGREATLGVTEGAQR
jgi:CBS domain-containing protein